MNMEIWGGILLPFAGTALGAACVFLMKDGFSKSLREALAGFSSGIMAAASVWSLLLPAIDESGGRFVPAFIGFWIGVFFLELIDRILPGLEKRGNDLLVLAVVLHNVPEGMAVGVIFAGWLAGNDGVTLAGAMALSLGIAIQNVPEGAIISMPLGAAGEKRGKAFRAGVLSGAVEPVGALLTLAASGAVIPLMPYFLSFAAGAMFTVVIRELIPEAGERSALWFAAGFTLMMALDVALG